MPNPLPVVWIAQQDGLCGAACAQIVLNARGLAAPDVTTQDNLWDEIKNNTTGGASPPASGLSPCGHFPTQVCEQCSKKQSFCWCTVPSALATTLNAHLGPGAVSLHKEKTEDDVTARAVESVDAGLGACVLVTQGTHWVVVYGYEPAAPTPSQPITHLYVRDPEFDAPSSLVDILSWSAFYLTDVWCGKFAKSSVAVSAGLAPKERMIVRSSKLRRDVPIAAPSAVLARARADADWLLTTHAWEASFRDGVPGQPLFVRDLTGSGLDYYLVDFRTGTRPTARIIYDAGLQAGGQYAGIDPVGDSQTPGSLPPFISADEIELSFGDRGRTIERQAAMGRVDSVEAELVWKPCDQSHSPYRPFYVAHRGTDTYFVRADGEVFGELTQYGAGA